GFRFGKMVQKRWPDEAEIGVGTMVGAALALLGFLLAFVTSIAIGNFNQRRQLVVLEANAIDTTYLRAGYLAEPYGTQSRELLREYVSLRIEALDPTATESAIARSEQIHTELWLLAEEIAKASPDPTVALYLESLNQVMDLHTERLNAELGFRVPPIIIYGLYTVAIITMILTGVYDSYHEKHNLLALIMVVMIISVVFLVIIDMDRSNVGLLQIPQKALFDLMQRLLP
ncbi:MAG TPA: hypothetical protein DEH22_10065, partial [Chloroflexi bacterium]|nr:hypothetical protein [Chloroflexota bacterium]